jgi:hypothetical protein
MRMVCGADCLKADGTVLEIAAADLGWVLSDSRAPITEAPPQVRDLLEPVGAGQRSGA